ncbi:TetR family transcriptional regulator [Isoptericola sp. NPDC056573]|uniref:TetR family transcriptional regulator n=1 Tax=Isoptericola sp. NPDC056573 TaxID=3345868 RepID=UPI0036B3A11D
MPPPTANPAPDPTPDRRAAAKARTRRAIVDGAAALMDETGGLAFSVDDLASRADVARRTVFNHFESLDDVIAAVAADAFASIHEALVAAPVPAQAGAPLAAVRADLVAAVRRADLVGPMASLARGLGLPAEAAVPPHQTVLILRAVADVGLSLTADLRRRHPGVDPVDVELEVARVTSGLVVLSHHWYTTTGGATGHRARAVWSDLILRLDAAPAAPTHAPEGHHG